MSVITANQIKSTSGVVRNVDSLQDLSQVDAVATSKVSVLSDQLASPTGGAGVGFTPTGTISSTTVQTAIAEVATDAAALIASNLTSIQNGTVFLLSGVAGTNTITATITPAITAYVTGQTFRFVAASANTGAVTININGLGAKAITKSGATALTTGDIPIGAVVNITYDGTQFQLSSGAGGSAGNTFAQSNLTVPAGTGLALVGPLTLSGTTTISGRLVIL
jgi:hypothetical protein